MSEVKKNKERLLIIEEEYARLPILVTQLLSLLALGKDQASNTETASLRYAFRMMMSKYVLEALIKKTKLGDIHKAAESLGENVLVEFAESADRIVTEMLQYADKEIRSRDKAEEKSVD